MACNILSGAVFFKMYPDAPAQSEANKVLNNFQLQPEKAEYIQLTEKEKEVLKYLVDGLSYKMIAGQLTVSFHTIHSHVKNIYEKLHVNSKGEAVAKAIKNRLV